MKHIATFIAAITLAGSFIAPSFAASTDKICCKRCCHVGYGTRPGPVAASTDGGKGNFCKAHPSACR